MKIPTQYSEWLPLLDAFAAGSDDGLGAMERGSIAWTPCLADRFVNRVTEAMDARLSGVSAGFQKRLDRARDPIEIRHALGWAQQQLPSLHRMAGLPVLTPPVRAHLDSVCRGWVERTRSALGSAVSADRRAHPEIRRMLQQRTLEWPPCVVPCSSASPVPATPRSPLR